jgi:hypothetical protein
MIFTGCCTSTERNFQKDAKGLAKKLPYPTCAKILITGYHSGQEISATSSKRGTLLAKN